MKHLIPKAVFLVILGITGACCQCTEPVDDLTFIRSASRLVFDPGASGEKVYEGEALETYLKRFILGEPKKTEKIELVHDVQKGEIVIDSKEYTVQRSRGKVAEAPVKLKIEVEGRIIELIEKKE